MMRWLLLLLFSFHIALADVGLTVTSDVPHALLIYYQRCLKPSTQYFCKKWGKEKSIDLKSQAATQISFPYSKLNTYVSKKWQPGGNIRFLNIHEYILVLGQQIPKRKMSDKDLEACSAIVRHQTVSGKTTEVNALTIGHQKYGLRCYYNVKRL